MRRLSEKEFREYSLSANVYSLIIQVGIPLAVFALFASLFSLLDTIMASHLGTLDVSTVSYMNRIQTILNSIGTGIGTGSMILINRSFGAKDEEKTNELVNTMVRLLLILSLVFLLMIPAVPWLLRLAKTPEVFIREGSDYLRFLIAATIVNFVNLVYISVEKSRGRTGVILICNLSMMALKLILSALFIYVFDKGVTHIALATFITYGSCALYAMTQLFNRNSVFCIRPSRIFRSRKGYAKSLLRMSCPVMVEDSAVALGNFLVNVIASSYGPMMIGALGVSNNVTGLAASFENGFSDASSSIVSQNYGGSKFKRVVHAYKANIVITFLACFFALAILYAVSGTIIPIFATSKDGFDAQFMETIRRIFIFDTIGCLGIALNGAGIDFLLGLGRTKLTLFLNFLKIFVLRIPLLFLLQNFICDGGLALGIIMLVTNCGIAIPTTIICAKVAKELREREDKSPADAS